MRKPAKSMAQDLRGQSPGGRGGDNVTVEKQRGLSPRDMVLPGEGGVESPPGNPPSATAKRYAAATGKLFGGGGE